MNALAALALLAAASPPPGALVLDPAASTVRYHLTHALHTVDGVSRSAEGKAIVDEAGGVRAMVRIPVQSFDSGDANRDSHMLETMEAGRFPFVVFKGVGSVAGATAGGAPAEVTLLGELELHGVKRQLEVPVTVELGRDGSARIRGRFTVSLEAHRIERPSLLLAKVDDGCSIAFDLRMRRAP